MLDYICYGCYYNNDYVMYLFVHVSSCEYEAVINAYRFDMLEKKTVIST